ncbi:MAG: thioesterase family protein [Myxococcales bacterium]|nr:thioesterase family protein [Myxococcales bacterium]
MADFRAASTITPLGEDRFAWDVPDGWQQGKGAFGGLVIGALARAMAACEPEPARALRSLTAELCAPMLTGATTIAVTALRRGRGITYLEARARQGDAVIARASGLFGAARPPTTLRLTPTPPTLAAFDTVAVAPLGQAPSPRFTACYEFRTLGPPPFAAAAEPTAAGWLRERGVIAAPRPLDAADVIGLLDAWWPCALVVEATPRPMATVAFTAELLVDPASLDPAAPFAYVAHLAGGVDGYSVELRHLWQGDRLVALNQQTFAAG